VTEVLDEGIGEPFRGGKDDRWEYVSEDEVLTIVDQATVRPFFHIFWYFSVSSFLDLFLN
jgi:hypothetical protein